MATTVSGDDTLIRFLAKVLNTHLPFEILLNPVAFDTARP
jgi:hypothetical protein